MDYDLNNHESVASMIIRRQFQSQAIALGYSVRHEVIVCGGRIDMVLGNGDVINQTMSSHSMTGIELKISLSDLKNQWETGKNFYNFHYNYLLIPNDIAYSALKYVNSNIKYGHVGVIVYDVNGMLHVERIASYYEPSDFMLYENVKKVEHALNETQKTLYYVYDSMMAMLTEASYNDDYDWDIYYPFIKKTVHMRWQPGEDTNYDDFLKEEVSV